MGEFCRVSFGFSFLYVYVILLCRLLLTISFELPEKLVPFSFAIAGESDYRNISAHFPILSSSPTAMASQVCYQLPPNADIKSCISFCALEIRLRRISYIQELIAGIFLEINPQYREVMQKSNNLAVRRRDHEMLAVMQNFDSLDAEEDTSIGSNNKVACFIGNQIRLHLLLSILSFESVKQVRYFTLSSDPDKTDDIFHEDDWGSVDELLLSAFIAKFLDYFPNKSIRRVELPLYDVMSLKEKWSTDGSTCSIILLPSDYDRLYFGKSGMGSLFTALFYPNDGSNHIHKNSVPIIWISDLQHHGIYSSESNISLHNIDDLYNTQFHWYVQHTWPRFSVLYSTDRDAEGFPKYYYLQAVLNKYDNYLTSSVYVGYHIANNEIRGSVGFLNYCLSSNDIDRENIVIIISYQIRIYSETAEGLKQQLHQELGYPHVLIIPVFTLEMVDVLNAYLVDMTEDQDDGDEGRDKCRSNVHVVQLVLTPHYPAQRLVSGLRYGLVDESTGEVLREVLYSYVVVQFEQEWFFRNVSSFLSGIPLLNDARSIWSFSEVQRDVVQRTYLWQLENENNELDKKYYHKKRNEMYPDYYRPDRYWPRKELEYKRFVDIIPVFAPCLIHMPCHQQFAPPAATVITESYSLVFFGLCTDIRRRFISQLFLALQGHEDISLLQYCELNDKLLPLEQPKGGLFGAQREKILLHRSSIILNINNYNTSVLEMHRIMYLLGMGKCIISQRGRDPSLSSLRELEGAVYFVDSVEDVMETVEYLLDIDDPDESEGEKEESYRYVKEGSVQWRWMQGSHGSRSRLARCERRSLEAYHMLHHLRDGGAGDGRGSDVLEADSMDGEEAGEVVYGTKLLKMAMDTLRHRLAAVEKV